MHTFAADEHITAILEAVSDDIAAELRTEIDKRRATADRLFINIEGLTEAHDAKETMQ